MRILLPVIFLLVYCGNGFSNVQQRPNVLWITIEDTSPQFLGAYGNNYAKTPTIDSLLNQGMRFTNAFSTGTVCSPSRTAIITGVKTYETGTGHHRSEVPLPTFIKGFPYNLKEAGYHTSNNVKTDYNVSNEEAFIKECWNESTDTAGWWNRRVDQPFFSVFNFMDSHQSRTMTQSYSWYREKVYERLLPRQRVDEADFELPPFFHDSPEMRREFARVYNALALTDVKVKELLNRLHEDGLTEETIIFFFADHGEGIPRAKTNGIAQGYKVPMGVWIPEKYGNAIKRYAPGAVFEELVDFTDLAPTVLSLAGIRSPEHFSGRAFIGAFYESPPQYLVLSSDRADNGIDMVRTITDGDYLYSKNFMPFQPELRYIRYMEVARMKQLIRSDFERGRLNEGQENLLQPRHSEFLFNLSNDIWEMKNLAKMPDQQKRLVRFRQLLRQELKIARDVMFVPEYQLNQISGTNPYEFRLDKKEYQIEEVIPVAFKSGLRGEETAKHQVDLLKNSDPLIRYWAVAGLLSQPFDYISSYEKSFIDALNDDYPPVAVLSAFLLFKHFGSAPAELKLKDHCLNPNPDLALMAINLCLYVEDKSPFVETVREVLKWQESGAVRSACMDFLGSMELVPNTLDYLR